MDEQFLEQLSAAGHIGPEASEIWVFGILPCLFFGLILVAIVACFRSARRARTATTTSSGQAIVYGMVEPDEDASPPVRVAITQRGNEWVVKGGWNHRWDEVARTISARPFYLRTPDGTSVRVEPDDGVFLVDGLDEKQRDGWTRYLVAELSPNEAAFVVGRVEQGFDPRAVGAAAMYRSTGTVPVVRPAPGQPMLISTEPLSDRFMRRAKFHGFWALGLALALLVNQVWFIGYIERHFQGVEELAQISNMRIWITRSRNSSTTHYGVRAVAPRDAPVAGEIPEIEVARQDYYRLDTGMVVPFVVVPGDRDASEIGRYPTVHVGLLIGAIVAALITLFSYLGTTYSTRPWYMRKKLSHGGSGRLVTSRTLVNSR